MTIRTIKTIRTITRASISVVRNHLNCLNCLNGLRGLKGPTVLIVSISFLLNVISVTFYQEFLPYTLCNFDIFNIFVRLYTYKITKTISYDTRTTQNIAT